MPPSPRMYKDAIYEQLSRLGKSLSAGPRLELLDLLCQGPRTVEVLARQMEQSVANTSHHLQVLRRTRMIKAEKAGVHVTYSLADEEVCTFYRTLRSLAESHLLEIEQVTRQPRSGGRGFAGRWTSLGRRPGEAGHRACAFGLCACRRGCRA